MEKFMLCFTQRQWKAYQDIFRDAIYHGIYLPTLKLGNKASFGEDLQDIKCMLTLRVNCVRLARSRGSRAASARPVGVADAAGQGTGRAGPAAVGNSSACNKNY
ncbi:hypothetical protein ACJJTC_006564 [Scirpophaga incertulas]